MMNSLRQQLSKRAGAFFSIYAIFAAFITYFAMYGFRKPFSVGRFDGSLEIFGAIELDYKILFVFSQVIGYTFSKFLGIKVVSESTRDNRIKLIIGFILFAELALFLFAIVPAELKAACLFLNGLPLGMIWGLVFSFLEGRRNTEFLVAGLSTSYIVASGVVKSVGKWVLQQDISEFWMPFVTGIIFVPMLGLGLYLLKQIPPPTLEDEKLRTRREPMDKTARKAFFKRYAPGLLALTLFYMLLTAYRDIRDNFARDIWDELGYQNDSLVFTSSEVPIALIVLVTLSLIMFIKSNRRAVAMIHGLLVGGALLIALSTWLFENQYISPLVWFTGVGLGLYLGYVPFGSVIFDRIIAETRFVGTAAFMIYVTDAFGYLGSVSVMFYKNFAHETESWLSFFISFSYLTSVACALGFGFSMIYFSRLGKDQA